MTDWSHLPGLPSLKKNISIPDKCPAVMLMFEYMPYISFSAIAGSDTRDIYIDKEKLSNLFIIFPANMGSDYFACLAISYL